MYCWSLISEAKKLVRRQVYSGLSRRYYNILYITIKALNKTRDMARRMSERMKEKVTLQLVSPCIHCRANVKIIDGMNILGFLMRHF